MNMLSMEESGVDLEEKEKIRAQTDIEDESRTNSTMPGTDSTSCGAEEAGATSVSDLEFQGSCRAQTTQIYEREAVESACKLDTSLPTDEHKLVDIDAAGLKKSSRQKSANSEERQKQIAGYNSLTLREERHKRYLARLRSNSVSPTDPADESPRKARKKRVSFVSQEPI